MVEAGEQTGLVDEALQAGLEGVETAIGIDDQARGAADARGHGGGHVLLDSDLALQGVVPGEVDDAKGALVDEAGDLVVAQPRADRQRVAERRPGAGRLPFFVVRLCRVYRHAGYWLRSGAPSAGEGADGLSPHGACPGIVAPRTARGVIASALCRTTNSRHWRGRRGVTAAEEASAFHREDDFFTLVEYFGSGAHETDGGAAGEHTRSDDGRANAQRVAGKDGVRPRQAFDAGRAEDGRIEQVLVANHAHCHGAGVPATGGKLSEQRSLGGSVVEVKGLRIELACEIEDGLAGDEVVAELARLVDREVFPVEADGASGRGRCGGGFGHGKSADKAKRRA